MGQSVAIREIILDDRRSVMEWRDDPVTRKIFGENESADWDKHCEWFEKMKDDNKKIICVGSSNTVRVGFVRFDEHADGEYEISVYIRPPYCGKGYALPMLRESITYLSNARDVKKLFSGVRKANVYSGSIFKEAGFSPVEKNDENINYELHLHKCDQVQCV